MLFQLINALQLILMMPLNNFTIPSFLTNFFSAFSAFNLQLFNLGDYITDLLGDLPVTGDALSDNFDDQGYGSQNIIINAFDSFMLIFQGINLFAISYTIVKTVKIPQ